jgi:hypothetical protein
MAPRIEGRFEMSAFSDSYVSRVLLATPTPMRGLDLAARRWRWLRISLFDPYRPELHADMIADGSEVIPVQECIIDCDYAMISASHADPKPWTEFSERTPVPEVERPPYSIICHSANGRYLT